MGRLSALCGSIPGQIVVETKRVSDDFVVERINHEILSFDVATDIKPQTFDLDPQIASKVDNLDAMVTIPTGK